MVSNTCRYPAACRLIVFHDEFLTSCRKVQYRIGSINCKATLGIHCQEVVKIE